MSTDWVKKAPATWNLKHLYQNDSDPQIQKDIQECLDNTKLFVDKYSQTSLYLSDEQELKKALDEYDEWIRLFGAVGKYNYYLSRRSSQDQTNSKIKAAVNKTSDISTAIVNQIQFFELSLAKMDKKAQEKMIRSNLLADYRHFLKRLFIKGEHTLSDPEEKILNLKAKTSVGNWYHMVSEFISKEERQIFTEDGKKVLLSFSEILSLTSSPSKKVRKAAGKKIDEVLAKHLDVATVELNTIIENKKIDDMLRKYSRADESTHIDDDISTQVVDSLIQSVTSQFAIPKKYYKFKAKLFGQKRLDYYERGADYGTLSKQFTYQDSLELIYDTFMQLDPEFAAILKSYVQNGQIDVFPAKGKTGGAYCAGGGSSKMLPTYILLNHTNKLNDVLTIAHELGHGINNELAKRKNNQLNFGTPTSTAEVASTFMEDFVLDKLLENCTDNEKLIILMEKLDSDIATIFRQVACYNFEFEIHTHFREYGYVAQETLCQLFAKHMSAYMGEASHGCENWWVYWQHLRYYFYVYSYSSGLLISKAMQQNVKKDKAYISKVKDFLSAGLSSSPADIFLDLGLDISQKAFWLSGLSEVEHLLDETMALAKKLKKI